MLGDLMNRMEGAKLEVKERLRKLTITKTDSNNWVSVKVSGERKIEDISISQELIDQGETGLLEDVITNVVNDAFSEAAVKEKELMEEVAKDIMPAGLGGLKGLFG